MDTKINNFSTSILEQDTLGAHQSSPRDLSKEVSNEFIVARQNNNIYLPLDIFGDVTPSKNIVMTGSDKFFANDPQIPGKLKNRHNTNINSLSGI